MSDTREKLFDLMNDSKNPAWWKFISNAEMLEFVDYLIANGIRLETKQATETSDEKTSEWIPVSERLPKQTSRCLVARYDYVTKTPFIDILWFEKGQWWNRLHGGDYAVTHWMPLPEPPKENDDEV